MRNLIITAAAALAFAASSAADARQSNDALPGESSRADFGEGEYGQEEYSERDYRGDQQLVTQVNDLDELIDWIDQMEAAFDSGSLLMIRPGDIDGGIRAAYLPVDRDDVIRAIRIQVALGQITAEQGAAQLIVMATETARHRRQFRSLRDQLVVKRRQLRGDTLQPWELGQAPAARATPAAPPPVQRSACPAASRWQVEVRGSQYSYHFVLVFRADGTTALVLPSGDEMTWVQSQGRISGNSLNLTTRDANGSGSLTATLSADCSRGTGQSQAYNGNNGPATLIRLN